MQEIEFHQALHRPGLLIDAGAHAGRMTIPLARLSDSRVLAFEPVPASFARLQTAVADAFGGAVPPHIALRREALGQHSGEVDITAPRVGGVLQDEWASITKDYHALRDQDARIDAVEHWSVPLLRLDELQLADVSAMKIDVEGAEQEALQGAWDTLQRCRPVLSIEIEERHRAGSTRDVPALLRQLDYEGWFEFYREWRRIETLDIATMQHASPSPAEFSVSHPYVFTFYFVPRERRAELARLARLEVPG